MIKTPVKFQKDQSKAVGGVVLTRYLLKTQNHAPWKAEYHVPLLFFEKAGDNKLTLACSLNESTTSLSTLDGLEGNLGTTILLALETFLPGFCLASSASVC